MGKKKNKPNSSFLGKSNNSLGKDQRNIRSRVEGGVYVYHGSLTIEKLAEDLNIRATDILKELFLQGKILNINSIIDDELIAEICINHGFDFKKEEIVSVEDFEKKVDEDDEKDLVERAPVVTIMGHVDHGKTTLIDTIRDSHIADKEAGLITQEIGAYQKVIKGKKITFLDTPGHEAFSSMRQRGASVTDIVVLVVAADDGVMPQTKEAIDHARAANVPIIVAINKIDKPGANPEKVMSELSSFGLVPEEWGGDTIMKPISAKKKIGIDDLLENILLVAELKELKANPSKLAKGSVIESAMDKKEGAKATLLVQNGTLHVGDCLVVGNCFCKVRRMTNEFKKSVNNAVPSTPVVITGLQEVPEAGDPFQAFSSEKEAKLIAQKRQMKALSQEKAQGLSITNLFDKIKEGEMEVINIIVKADTEGTVQAITDSLSKIEVDGVSTKIIHAASGDVTEGDIILASASSALVLAFNVRSSALVLDKAKELGIEIRNYDIIYKLLEEMEQAMLGKLKPEYVEVTYGQAVVKATFKASKVGIIAGSLVTEGKVVRGSMVKILRGKEVVFEGHLTSLKREKDDVKEVQQGFECGIVINGYKDVQVDDVIISSGMEEKR
ncbi:MAG: translation initiation factor IF-2 [Bacilli bacterium]|nr:translation initiation factor IF-2 [Bacilli bacterium]MDD7375191.1 translation initiation factor IF-2 [Bacilli bacterium]MDD7549459.1 translation initiation factor IF-2 [Bacilli bacterium]MDY4155574.1 translation initiation factor IF-2 [Bacilli bacterium]MDY4724470.1 translation initiation factor IF-2 [Bacilli bacterium]